MSLLDDVSIVVTPNGYKAGELYAVKPTFALGSELITNGDFSNSFTNWVAEGGSSTWVAEDNVAKKINSSNFSLYQTITRTVGKRYQVNFDVSEYTSGTLSVSLGGGTSTNITSSGSYSFNLVWDGSSSNIIFRSTFIGSIDNISVKEYTSADMDVTRATAGTRVDEDGLVNYAEVLGGEEITNGDFATDSDWTKGIGWTISGGSASHTGGASYLSQDVLQVDTLYKVNISVTAVSGGGFVQIYMGNSPASVLISQIGDYTYYFTSQSSVFLGFALRSLGDVTIDNVSVKEAARDNVPRIDYTGGGCPHILAEPQRTNLIQYSEDFSQSYWNKQSGVTPTYNTTETLSPDGTYNATKFIGNGSSGVLRAGVSITGVVARSVYLKSVTGTVNVVLKDPNQTVTSKSLTVTTEWQRFDLTEDNTITLQGIWIDDIPVSGIYMWGAQLEEGSYATSYIPTSGSTVTRNQDIFSRDGIGSLINDSEGTLYFEGSALENGGGIHRIISLSDGSYDNLIYIRIDSTASRFRGFSRGSSGSYTIITVNSIPQTDNNKIALVWDATNFRIWINGSERATATINNLPVGMNTLNLADPTSSGNFFGKVKQLQVYNTALTDEQLLQLTGESGTDFYESYAEMAAALTYTIQ